MFRTSSRKNSIIIAVIAILLCMVAITGSTLALFTSNDGKIGINTTSGKLKVNIIDASEKPESLVGEALNLVTTATNPKGLFEPGATLHTEGFRIRNDGNIPLNYILYISEDAEVDPRFFGAFDVWITTNSETLEKTASLDEFKGSLKPEECSDIYYLVFRMKETVGNEFQGLAFNAVGVTVCAVQGNVDIK